jgi:hypothetical protein
MIMTKQKGQNLSKVFIARAIMMNPDVHSIAGKLSLDNYTAYINALAKKMTPAEAIQQTPAYKVRRDLGFTKIDLKRSHLPEFGKGGDIYLVMTRP